MDNYTPCDRCARRHPAVRALGVEAAGIARAVGVYSVRAHSGRVTVEALCVEDVRGMRAFGYVLSEQ